MYFICDNCGQKIKCKHYWNGVPITCPNCFEISNFDYDNNQSKSDTRYAITFYDFKKLVTYEPYYKIIHPLINEYFNCSINKSRDRVTLITEDGAIIPLEIAHIELQLNSSAQKQIYNAAMSLWR